MPREPRRSWALAIAVGALTVAVSYVVQRLWDAASEPPITVVRKMAITPYYWRVGVALVHGGIATAFAAAGRLGDHHRRAPTVLAVVGVGVALVGGVAMLGVP